MNESFLDRLFGATPARTSKHRQPRTEEQMMAYRRDRKAKNKAASRMRAIQRRLDRQSSKRQRSGA